MFIEGMISLLSNQGKDGKQAENMIYTVLRQRHMKEAIHLEDQLARAREAALRQRLADIEQQRQEERDKLLSAFEQVGPGWQVAIGFVLLLELGVVSLWQLWIVFLLKPGVSLLELGLVPLTDFEVRPELSEILCVIGYSCAPFQQRSWDNENNSSDQKFAWIELKIMKKIAMRI